MFNKKSKIKIEWKKLKNTPLYFNFYVWVVETEICFNPSEKRQKDSFKILLLEFLLKLLLKMNFFQQQKF